MSDDEQAVDPFEDFEEGDTYEEPVAGYLIVERTNDQGDRYAELVTVSQAEYSVVAGTAADREAFPDGWGPSVELNEGDEVVGTLPAPAGVSRIVQFTGGGFRHSHFEMDGKGMEAER